MTLLAFHNDPTTKEKYVTRVKAHALADEIIQGKYWENGRGCAVGCTLHSSNHEDYETELGIPQILARLEDRIFEGLDLAKAKAWPLEFLDAIPVGKDLSNVWPKFAIWLLTDKDHGCIKYANDAGKIAIQKIADMYQLRIDGKEPTLNEWIAARRAAAAYADAAYAAGSSLFGGERYDTRRINYRTD